MTTAAPAPTADLTTATPVEIDTALAALYTEGWALGSRLGTATNRLHRAAGHRSDRYGNWNVSLSDTLAAVQALTEDPTYRGTEARRALADYDVAREAVAANRDAQAPYHAEWERRGGWTRAFLVVNHGGHVHKSMQCSTCHDTTRFHWMPEYSGADEAGIIDAAGERACTVCYPNAPVEALARPTRMFSPDEVKAAEARAERETAAAARQAKRIADGLTADGSPLSVVTERGVHPADYWHRPSAGQPYERAERFQTERAARQWYVQQIVDGYAVRYAEALSQIVTAIAAKHGMTEDAVIADLDAKAAAKRKRDAR